MGNGKGKVLPPRDLSVPKIFEINAFKYGYNEQDLINKGIFINLVHTFRVYLDRNKNLGEAFESIIKYYKKFLVTEPKVKYDINGEPEIDEMKYFKDSKDLEEELREILNIANEGDIIKLNFGTPYYIHVYNSELVIKEFNVILNKDGYLFPVEGIEALLKYKIIDINDVNRLYPKVDIIGIFLPISSFPSRKDIYRTGLIPFLFGDENNYDLKLTIQDHNLYVINVED